MKNYNKILEAVNRGIKFALDDYEDNELQGQVNSKVKYQGGMNEYIDLMKIVVDLGLPSGTLWCKYNLGCDYELLNNHPENTKPKDWCGDYYAWGELETNKPKYDWPNYKFGSHNKLTKYCNNPKYGLNGFIDNLTELLPEDDAAYQFKKCHNFKFHIPTKEQCEELINYTTNYWVNNYDPNKTIHNPKDDGGIQGLNGRVFIGQNGNQLFIPAINYSTSSSCSLWSSSLYLNEPYCAYRMFFYSDNIQICHFDRCIDYQIRPVINL